ncbi:MAG TPA: hypothetical protein VLH08_15780 [Acidobacteriota bacterium]|nr:hypothetical protein [Acidobacteriota bacterium]
MTRTERIQWQIFILLIAALGASIFYFSKTSTEPSLISNFTKRESRSTPSVTESLPQLAMLQGKVPEFQSVHRNVFEFAGEEEPSEPIEEPQPVVSVPQTVPLGPVGPDVTYLGFYKERDSADRKLAAITNGGQIYVGGQGEVLAGKYRVIEVEDEFIVVEYLPDHRIVRVELGRHHAPPPMN